MAELNYAEVVDHLVNWIKKRVEKAGKKGGIVGLSGGIDSSVTAALLKRAFPENSFGLIMPCCSSPLDKQDAYLVSDKINMKAEEVDLNETFATMLSELKNIDPGEDKVAAGNIKPRLRMTALYYLANRWDYLVVGTGNKSELVTGYFTKYGDGAVDISPLASLVKTEVRELARELDIPESIIERRPSAGLWEGQTDEEEMGLSYEKIDEYILEEEIEDEEAKEKIKELENSSRHKVNTPPLPERDKLLEKAKN
ncbi:NAD(+) synthase [Halarsenatibacter silvermanii]|uniref:NH(3)-dependent NAD(+) synthetase n=1 Tax=Halarsenatibacter silvermanii TaxID=321763 RepID=A0A1G9MXI3_9FIRM|nr:NAD(+) synthase [Halarsenatibacter silvermanii]SDL78938.1 NH(3)-dependent NAD(+) synthetase [Halarsenatibacter silvermanii]